MKAVDALHNLLRTTIIHFDRDWLSVVITALSKNPAFPQALPLALDSDAWTWGAEIRSRRVLDNPAFFDRIPMNGLSYQVPLAGIG